MRINGKTIEQLLKEAHAEGFRHGMEHACAVMAGLVSETSEQSTRRAYQASSARLTALTGRREVQR